MSESTYAIVKMKREIISAFLKKIFYLADFSKVFKFRFVHLGGDEVDTSKYQ